MPVRRTFLLTLVLLAARLIYAQSFSCTASDVRFTNVAAGGGVLFLGDKGIRQLNHSHLHECTQLDTSITSRIVSVSFSGSMNSDFPQGRGTLTAIMPRTFADLNLWFPNVTQLEIQGNPSLHHLSAYVFSDMELDSLFLDYNALESIDNLAFSNLTLLSLLALNDNILNTVPTFTGLKRVRSLNLGNSQPHDRMNMFVTVKSHAFVSLRSAQLQQLVISSAQIENLGADAFSSLSELVYLDLEFNVLDATRMPPSSFTGLHKLRKLKLGHNDFSLLTAGLFAGLINLRLLELYHNDITSISVGAFSGLENLQELDLSWNALCSLQKGSWDGLDLEKELRTLNLDRNFILTVGADTFPSKGSLRILQMYNKSSDGATSTVCNVNDGELNCHCGSENKFNLARLVEDDTEACLCPKVTRTLRLV